MTNKASKQLSKTSPIQRNQGRIEYLAQAKKINALIKTGFSYAQIYRLFKLDGKFTMSYSTFVYHVKNNPISSISAEQVTGKKTSAPSPQPNTNTRRYIMPSNNPNPSEVI